MNTIGSIFDISIAESQALLIHGLEVIIVDLENVGKEEDGPAKEDNWEEDSSNLEQLEIGLNLIFSLKDHLLQPQCLRLPLLHSQELVKRHLVWKRYWRF